MEELMGEVVASALIAHVPTIVLPEEVRRSLNNGKESTLVTGLEKLRSDFFKGGDYDLVIVFDSHWFTTVEFVVTSHSRRSGYFTSEELPRGMSQREYDIKGDPILAKAIEEAGAKRGTWITAIDDPYLPINYATTNVWEYLGKGIDKPWISIGVCQTATVDDFLTVGQAVADAIEASNKRVVLIASGAMSHTFWPLKELRKHEAAGVEHIFSKDAYEADMVRLEALERGDHAQVLDTMDDFYRFRPEARFGHYLMMAGACGGRQYKVAGERYGEYENSIGTGQVHVFFDHRG
jgi:3,4-dihydroxyphenylacetate 2,3-dioxygenase